jgi:hypothetical protein
MADAIENFWDSLSRNEVDSARAITEELKDQGWAAPILAGVRDNGGIAQAENFPPRHNSLPIQIYSPMHRRRGPRLRPTVSAISAFG